MSQENVEVIKRTVEAWNRDDFEAFIAFLDPEIEWYTAIERFFEGTQSVFRGHAGARAAWESYRGEDFERLDVRHDEFRDLGDSVLVLGQITIVGRSSQVELTSEIAQLFTVADGRIVVARDFLSHAEGLEAAGLSE